MSSEVALTKLLRCDDRHQHQPSADAFWVIRSQDEPRCPWGQVWGTRAHSHSIQSPCKHSIGLTHFVSPVTSLCWNNRDLGHNDGDPLDAVWHSHCWPRWWKLLEADSLPTVCVCFCPGRLLKLHHWDRTSLSCRVGRRDRCPPGTWSSCPLPGV